MKCNKSVKMLRIYLLRREVHNERIQLFATLATGGWSSIQELVLYDELDYMSLWESEYISHFILQSKNLRTLSLQIAGRDETMTIIETLSRTEVQSLQISFNGTFSLHTTTGGRRLATPALIRCTCITELRLVFLFFDDQVECFQILWIESIPKMLGVKKFELNIMYQIGQGSSLIWWVGALEDTREELKSWNLYLMIGLRIRLLLDWRLP
jgi:hypothetical protein